MFNALHFEISLAQSTHNLSLQSDFGDKRDLSVAFNSIKIYEATTDEEILSASFADDIEPIFGLCEREDWGRWSKGKIVSFVVRHDFTNSMKKVVIEHSIHQLCMPGVSSQIRINAKNLTGIVFSGGSIEIFLDLSVHDSMAQSYDLKNPTAILVLGMHRSGTSAITRVLSLAGAALPLNLMPPAADNSLGFWESTKIAYLNDRLLNESRSSWLDIFAFIKCKKLNQRAIQMASEVINSEYPKNFNTVVLKDPRINLMKSLWSEALNLSGFRPVIIIMIRDPLEIAASLYRRNGLSLKHSLFLWAGYTISAYENDGISSESMVFTFEQLIRDPLKIIDEINKRSSINLSYSSETVKQAITDYINEDLRHRATSEFHYPPGFEIVEELYNGMIAASEGETVDCKALIRKSKDWLCYLESIFGSTLDYEVNKYFTMP